MTAPKFDDELEGWFRNTRMSEEFLATGSGHYMGDYWMDERDVRRKMKEVIANVTREIVELSFEQEGQSPEWLTLIMDVREGKYTPPDG